MIFEEFSMLRKKEDKEVFYEDLFFIFRIDPWVIKSPKRIYTSDGCAISRETNSDR
jgi:hypothetical protein